jgi:hypothetical protein
MSNDQVPDAVPFEFLQALSREKSNKLDFSAPTLRSRAIGDLAFLVNAFIEQVSQDNEVMSSQYIFLVDVLVTSLRRSLSRHMAQLKENGAPTEELMTCARFYTMADMTEDVFDQMVRECMKKAGGDNDTKPSYQLIRSLGVDIKPHEVEEWMKERYAS